MDVEIMVRETIKPSSPTTPHLKTYKLSFIDHVVFRSYVPLVFFYEGCFTGSSKISEISTSLKKSLSETLSLYYPVAGKIKDRVSIDCNDEGVLFVEAQIRHKLAVILENPTDEFLEPLFADKLQWKEMDSSSTLLAIQISFFDCGGMAISVCMSHKFADTSTMTNFIKDWANLSLNCSTNQQVLLPVLNAASVFPHGELPIIPEVEVVKSNTVCRRLVFNASKIDELKTMIIHKVKNPTRVELVAALIYKSAIAALRSTSTSLKKTTLMQAVNLRKRMIPSLPEKSVGNMVWNFMVYTKENSEVELHDLVSKQKEALMELCNKYVENFSGEKWFSLIMESMEELRPMYCDENQVVYKFASWCRFPLYEIDFGWGKPIWVSTIGCEYKNSIVLMDTRNGDGIEAFVNLEKQDMAIFECDKDILSYAFLNPSVPLTCNGP
ncbi:vinorine synthase-like [Quillaja saponaria]|uniref:Vinorine synthase-like n=1 Tax=Quillaja saponaria TaxID=32244 RepID=A0AAD7LGS3_QUISA|nr:vinorine synthase-like [Quillaja saponaria]